MVRSVKNADNITAAGLEECPASAKGRLNHVTDSNAASNIPVLSGPLRSTFPEVIYWLLGVSLPWCGCLSGAYRTKMLSDAQWEDFHLGRGVLRCSSSSTCPYYWLLLNFLPLKCRFGRGLSIRCLSRGIRGETQPRSSSGCVLDLKCKAQGCRASGCDGCCL